MAEYIEREALLRDIECYVGGEESRARFSHWVQVQKAADVVPGSDFRDCRNELCLRCGQYKTKHLGSCDGCRWENV